MCHSCEKNGSCKALKAKSVLHGTTKTPTFCNLESYVDDSKLFMSFPLVELDAAIEKLEQDLHNVAQWCCENHLLINPDKTKLPERC